MRVEPLASASSAARVYLPAVILSRGLSVIRLMLVALILGDANRAQFGLYQPALELINWLVPLVMFGMGDVAERYAGSLLAAGTLKAFLQKQIARIAIIGSVIASVFLIASPWLLSIVWQASRDARGATALVLLSGLTIAILAAFQVLASLLRGLRAYHASVGLEISSSVLFLLFSIIAAFFASAPLLIAAYTISLAIPLAFFLVRTFGYLSTAGSQTSSSPSPTSFASFASWTLLRLLLVMTFTFIAIWSVGWLSRRDASLIPQEQIAEFSMPFRLAQMLAFFAVAAWASVYGIAANLFSQGRRNRSQLLLFRMMYYAGLLMYVGAFVLFITRDWIAELLPQAYRQPMVVLLPPSLAVFLWFGLLSFATVLSDLRERPQRGAFVWAAAVIIQLVLVFTAPVGEPKQAALYACVAGLGVAVLVLAPMLTWRPLRFTATSVPMIFFALMPLALLAPPWVVNWVATPMFFAIIGFGFVWTRFANPFSAMTALLRSR